MCAVCVFSVCAAFSRACSFRSNNLCIRVCCSDRWYNLRCGWKLAGRSNSGCGNFRVDGGKINFFVFCNNCAGNRFCCDRFGCRNLFRCGFGCRSLRFPEEYFPVPAVPKQMAVPRLGFLPVRMAVPERMVLERPVLPELPVQMALLEEMAPGQLPVFPGLRYSKQEKSSPPKNP